MDECCGVDFKHLKKRQELQTEKKPLVLKKRQENAHNAEEELTRNTAEIANQ